MKREDQTTAVVDRRNAVCRRHPAAAEAMTASSECGLESGTNVVSCTCALLLCNVADLEIPPRCKGAGGSRGSLRATGAAAITDCPPVADFPSLHAVTLIRNSGAILATLVTRSTSSRNPSKI